MGSVFDIDSIPSWLPNEIPGTFIDFWKVHCTEVQMRQLHVTMRKEDTLSDVTIE